MTLLRRGRSSSPPMYRSPSAKTPKRTLFPNKSVTFPADSPLPQVVQSSPEFSSPDPYDPESPSCGTPSKSKSQSYSQVVQSGSPLSSVGTCCSWTVATFVIFLAAIGGVGVYGKYTALQRQLEHVLAERDAMSEKRNMAVAELKQASDMNGRFQVINENLKKETDQLDDKAKDLRKEKDQMSLRMVAEKHQRELLQRKLEDNKAEADKKFSDAEKKAKLAVDSLKASIQKQSRREVMEKYGPGPHRVEFELSIPEGKDSFQIHHMTVETSPLDLMPHSVNMFLRQVTKKLWDGTEIFRNREHILVARATDHETQEDRFQKFQSAGADKLAFREYSDKFPHVMYTLGYAGRPAGPHFYINTMDNTNYHGPTADSGNEGDPCFAKIIKGVPLVDMISALPSDHEDKLVRPVVIKKAVMLKQNSDGQWVVA